MTPRGIRNNNPGNIRTGSQWQGLVPEAEREDKAFCEFISPAWGIRAMATILLNYQRKYGISTIKGIINRWAPSVENNSDAYVRAVSTSTGILPNAPIMLADYSVMFPLVKAIIMHENGQQPYPDLMINEGLKMAGVLKPITRVTQTPVGAGTATAAGTGAIAAAVEGYQQVQPITFAVQSATQGTASWQQWGSLIVGALVFISIAAALYALWHKTHEVAATAGEKA